MDFILETITKITYIVTAASIIAAFTESKKDDIWIDKLLGYIDLLALNFKITINRRDK